MSGAAIAVIIIVIILILVGLGIGLYFLYRSRNTSTTPPPSTTPSNGKRPTNLIPVGLAGPACPNGAQGAVAPEGCTGCATAGVFWCPADVISSGSNNKYTSASLISCFRDPQYDPENPEITIAGKQYYWREGSPTVCIQNLQQN